MFKHVCVRRVAHTRKQSKTMSLQVSALRELRKISLTVCILGALQRQVDLQGVFVKIVELY